MLTFNFSFKSQRSSVISQATTMVWRHKIEATIHAVYHSGKSWFFGSQKVEKLVFWVPKLKKLGCWYCKFCVNLHVKSANPGKSRDNSQRERRKNFPRVGKKSGTKFLVQVPGGNGKDHSPTLPITS